MGTGTCHKASGLHATRSLLHKSSLPQAKYSKFEMTMSMPILFGPSGFLGQDSLVLLRGFYSRRIHSLAQRITATFDFLGRGLSDVDP